MRTIVRIDGEEYEGKEEKQNYREAAQVLKSKIGITNSLSLELENGGILVLGKKAIQMARFEFLSTEVPIKEEEGFYGGIEEGLYEEK